MPFGRFKTHSPETTSPRSLSFDSTTAPSRTATEATQPGEGGSKVLPSRTNTQATTSSSISSTSDEPASSRSSISSRLPLSRLHAAVSRGNSTQSAQSAHSLPDPETPLQLAELAISTILTIPGPSIEELRRDYFPKLFHEAYSHRANTREHGLKELENLIQRFRSKFEVSKVFASSNVRLS
jgi:hypothetical protein